MSRDSALQPQRLGTFDLRLAWCATFTARQYRMRALGGFPEELNDAHRAFLEAAQIAPKNVRVRKGLAKTHFYRGEVSPALQNLDLVLDAEPDDVDCLVMRGRARVILGRIDDGISDLDRVIRIDANHVDARQRLIECGLLFVGREFARPHIEWLRDLQPRSVVEFWLCLGAMGIVDGNREQSQLEAADRVDEFVRRYPDAWEAWSTRGGVFFRRQKYKQAVEAVTKALSLVNGEVNPYQIYQRRAQAYEKMQEWEKARDDWAQEHVRSYQTLVASVPARHLGENGEMGRVRIQVARRASSLITAARS